MISPSEAYSFIDANVSILANSGINIDVSKVRDSIENGTFTKNKFFSYVEDEITRFIYKWSYSVETRKSFDINLLIIRVHKSGKHFKYTYLKDVEPFRSCKVKSIEQGDHSLIISFFDGKLYRMTFPLKSESFNKNNVILSQINNMPQEFDAAELKDTMLQILKPILEFKHEDEQTTIFMKNEFLKLIPFENHSWITRDDEIQVANWEYCISNGPWKLTRDRVKKILNMFISILNEYADDNSAPYGWRENVNNTILSINSIIGVTRSSTSFVNSTLGEISI